MVKVLKSRNNMRKQCEFYIILKEENLLIEQKE